MSDDVVLEAINDGLADDRHLDWLDGLFRQAIISNLCISGLTLREPLYAEQIDTSNWFLAVHRGVQVMAQPADTPIPWSIEAELSGGVFTRSIPDRDTAERLHHCDDPRRSAVLWLRARLVAKALGPDLGRGFRAGLDRAHATGELGALPFDMRRPHSALYQRLLRLSEALVEPCDQALIINAKSWEHYEDLWARHSVAH
jgi:hypothetical protein